ncbi:MAG: hypothetical protein V3U07_00850 [Nitrospirales bacterium]
MYQDSASRDLPAQISQPASRVGAAVVEMLQADISSTVLQTPSLFTISIGSSVMWKRYDLVLFPLIKRSGAEEGRKKLEELKAKVFDTRTKRERVARSLKLLSEIKPIEGLDKTIWKSIVEETALEDTYGD